ncbi:MAG: L,D-transpeptidase [Anaerolineae bacterium]|nr:L,D-transpeptidase [Anaerolineae bacterium]
MEEERYSRRDFLKLAALGLGSLAFRPFFDKADRIMTGQQVRIATDQVSIYSQPNDQSSILYTRFRDDLLNVYEEIKSDFGPEWNPVWYRVWRGYIHSARLQTVETRLNTYPSKLAAEKQLAEVTVPFTQSMRWTKYDGWTPLYRLYYQSIQWMIGIEEGPDGSPWYRIRDEADGGLNYFAPAEHLRLVTDEELAPISPDVPYEQKRIEVNLATQTLKAYEYDQVVMDTKISSGLPTYRPDPNLIPTDTPTGDFTIQSKYASKHMGDGRLTANYYDYELPGVPWCLFFAEHGVAIHGTYWHTNFGVPMSHGCVNMRSEEAKWIYRWAYPVIDKEDDIYHVGLGTPVRVR